MWKTWLKGIFSPSGQKHPLDRKPVPLDKHPLGEEIGRVIIACQSEALRLQHQKISSGHLLLALTKYPRGLAQQALVDLDILPEKVEPLLTFDSSSSNVPSGAFLILPEINTIFQKAQDEAHYFKREQIASEHILLALTQFENMAAYSILQQLSITPKILREKVYELFAHEIALDGPPTRTDPEKIERFTNRSRKIQNLSQQIAEERRDRIIGVEHLLMALLREGGSVAARSLHELGVTTEKLEPLVYSAMKPIAHENKVGELSKDVKRTLEFAVDEARRRNHNYIGAEYLLLGLVRQKDLVPVKVLEQLGITPQMIRAKIKAILAEESAS